MRLFHPKVIGKALITESIKATDKQAEIATAWVHSIENHVFERETSHDAEFIQRIMVDVLGYSGSGGGSDYTIAKNIPLKPKGNVDVALGRFAKGTQDEILVPFELKGAKTKDLDAVMAGRHKSPVEQAWEYAAKVRGAQWVLVSNYKEIRLYAVGYGQQYYESFDLSKLNDPAEFARASLLLRQDNLLGGRTHELLKDSERAGKEITNRLYRDYKSLRETLIDTLARDNRTVPQADIIRHAQTILDRILFIAFAKDKGLLSQNTLADAYAHKDPYNPKPIWENFKGLFRAIDKGNRQLNIPEYNGGLFQADTALESLQVSDLLCEGFKLLGDYDFDSEVSVTVLGHIFEQSISDLEELHATAEGKVKEGAGKRKKEGVVYTPDTITRFIVEETLGEYLHQKFESLMCEYGITESSTGKVYKNKKKAIAFWEHYQKVLRSTKVLDPACGSGAFLVAAFDHLNLEYKLANSALAELTGNPSLFDLDKEILSQNLYGVDINPESIEITKLSLWLKTARRGKVLNSLDDNLRVGDSLIEDSNYSYRSFAWKEAFPDILFDVVIGNPPYVRQEFISHLKPYLQKRYEVYNGTVDLYAYFYELGLRLLKSGGKLGYISSSTFFKTSSGKQLRAYLSANAALEKILDFGDLQIFEGVTTYPVIMVMDKAAPQAGHHAEYLKLKALPESDLSMEFTANAQPIAQANLKDDSWTLEADNTSAIRRKISAGRKTLKEVYGSPLYGIKTGLNEAFVIDRATRDRLVTQSPQATTFMKPFLEGKDLNPWHCEPRDLYLICIPKGWTRVHYVGNTPAPEEANAWAWLKSAYPAIAEHLAPFAEAGRKRGDKGDYWWELRACAYYDLFDKPKIMYPDISQWPKFSLDSKNYLFTNTTYFIPSADWFLLGLLNSKIIWFMISGMANAIRGGFTRLFTQHIETIPIPDINAKQRTTIAALAEQCQRTAEERYNVQQTLRRRLPDLAPVGSAAKLNTKLTEWWGLDFPAFRKEIQKVFKADIPLAERNAWEAYLNEHKTTVQRLTQKLADLEAQLNIEVCKAYGLSVKTLDILAG